MSFKKLLAVASVAMLASVGFCHGKMHQKATVKTVVLKPGQTSFTVSLPANATTGYLWFVKKMDRDAIKLSHYQYQVEKHPKGMVGTPGVAHFTFNAQPDFLVGPQTTKIWLSYNQPWSDSGKSTQEIIKVISLPKMEHTSSTSPSDTGQNKMDMTQENSLMGAAPKPASKAQQAHDNWISLPAQAAQS